MTNQDEQYLNLLSIFHYVVGGIAALFACFPIIHVVMGVLMLTGVMADNGGPPAAFGIFFVAVGALMVLVGWAFAVLLVLAGYFLSARRHHTFCLVMAAVACIFMPFGTVLGVFTIIVLVRPSVRQLFGIEPDLQPVDEPE
ncbi:MAG: hypothetical protein PVJ27_11765 [Candidatus Brocadiaceae bacterium]|jgi:hypothetical protein